jgi:hypothetical protein
MSPHPARTLTTLLIAAVSALALAPSAGHAAGAKPKVAPSEARTVTKQALAQTAGLIDAKKVVVKDCDVHGDRALCEAVMRGPRQTLHATVSIRELPDDYVVRVLRLR